MFGIESYTPCFYENAKDIMTEHAKQLNNIVGKRIIDVWIVWDAKNDEWFKDCPVVLDIEGIQLELCTTELDKLSITYNTIDMSAAINWYGTDAFILEWRKNALKDFTLARSKMISSIDVIEYLYETDTLFSRENPKATGEKKSSWILNGIGFTLEDSYFSVYNGLDQNEISFQPDLSSYVRTKNVCSI